MASWKVLVALIAGLAVALAWSLAGLSTGVGQAVASVAAFAVVWLALGLLPRLRAKSAEGLAERDPAETAISDPVLRAQRELLARVSSALADQQRVFDDTETQLRDLRTWEQRALANEPGDEMADANRYRMATVRSQIEQLENLLGTVSTNIVALQTQRGAIQTAVAAHTMPTPQMVMEIQNQLQQAQSTLALADEGTRSIQDLSADLILDREDLIGDLVGAPEGITTSARRPQPATPVAEQEM